MVEYQELTKEQFDLLASALDWNNKKCCKCGKEITRHNFGIIHADYVCCNDIICQIAAFDKLEEGAKLGSIAEHYHCGIIEDSKDESLIELSVAQDNGDWCVFDDWNELREDKILFRSKSQEKTLFECYKILCTKFKVKYIMKGAGCPNSFLKNKTVADFTQGGQE